MIEHALSYAARGWHIFPVGPDKAPRTAHGFKDATTDENKIKEWWKRWPQAGIGLATGGVSGVWVLDVDGEKGQRSIAEFELECDASIPRTLTARTPSERSAHHFFSCHPRGSPRSGVGILPNVDIRGDGGYVILPPSECINKQGRMGFYAWINRDDPLNPEESDCVMAILELLKKEEPRIEQPNVEAPPNRAWGLAALQGEYEKVVNAAPGTRNPELNKAAFKLGRIIGGGSLDEDEVRARMIDACRENGLATDDGETACHKTISSGLRSGVAKPKYAPKPVGELIKGWSGPAEVGLGRYDLLAAKHLEDTGYVYARYEGEWYRKETPKFVHMPQEDMEDEMWRWARVQEINGAKGPRPLEPTSEKIRNLLRALRAQSMSFSGGSPPLLNGQPCAHYIPLLDGVLDIRTLEARPYPEGYFTTYNLLVQCADVGKKRSKLWEDFVDSVFGDDQESKELLQDWFGYVLAPGNPFEKLLLIEGVSRGGKGVIQTALTTLLGGNIAAPTLNTLSERFGLASLVGLPLAIIPDARSSLDPARRAVALERMLSIAGNDSVTIDRKFFKEVKMVLPCKIVLMANKIPKLSDNSRAIVERVLPLKLVRSFRGREDTTLKERLSGETEGILTWALEGLRRLRKRGHFVIPESSGDMLGDIQEDGSPLGLFLEDHCVLDPQEWCPSARLFGEWEQYCSMHGFKHSGTATTFIRNLKEAALSRGALLESVRRRDNDGNRFRAVTGVTLQ